MVVLAGARGINDAFARNAGTTLRSPTVVTADVLLGLNAFPAGMGPLIAKLSLAPLVDGVVDAMLSMHSFSPSGTYPR